MSSKRLRNAFVDGPRSLGGRSRNHRWKTFRAHFTDIESMSVVDLGGTVDYWMRSPVQPRSVHVLNLQEPPSSVPDWITVDVADATDPALLSRAGACALVSQNSAIDD